MQRMKSLKSILWVLLPAFLLVVPVATTCWAVPAQVVAGADHTLFLKSDGTLWGSGANQDGQLGDGSVLNRSTPVQIGGGWRSVSTGAGHTLAVKTDGTLWSWGSNSFGQLGLPAIGTPPNETFAAGRLSPVQIGTSSNWVTVVAAGFSSYALQGDGSLWVWGDNSLGQLGDGSLTSRAEPFKLPAPQDPQGNPSNGFFTAIAASGEHTLALQADGSLWATGFNLFGQLGNGSLLDRTGLVKIGSDSGWVSIAAGETHSAAIRSDGSLWTWGANDQGQLGNGSALPGANVTTPAQIAGTGSDNHWVGLSAGMLHTLALKRDGTLWTWGLNSNGQLGNGNTAIRNVPTRITAPAAVASDIVAIAAGELHSLALKANGQLYAWGDNALGQFGNGATPSSLLAVAAQSNSYSWISTEPGRLFTAAIRSNGTLWSWGSNASGQLGIGSLLDSSVPTQVASSSVWRSVTGGTNHAVALAADGTLWAWGSDATGQLGNGTATATATVPQNILISALVDPQLSDNDWMAVSAGTGHTVALKADGSLWSWGDNTSGQLGMFDPFTISTTNTPGRVSVSSGVPAGFNNGWVTAAAGGTHTLALQADGTLWSWGSNFSGEAGINTASGTFFFTPRAVIFDPPPAGAAPAFNSSWRKISAGLSYSVGLQADGSLWVWGANNFNQLGNNSGIASFTPIRVNLPAPVISIFSGLSHTLALLSNGTLWSWGRNDNGQLGINSTAVAIAPQQISSSSPAGAANVWSSAGGGGLHSVLLRNDGTLWSSGSNSSGQGGLGALTQVQIPTRLAEPRSTVAPLSLSFGNGVIGGAPVTRTVTITNSGTAPLQATISSSDPAAFGVAPLSCGTLAPAASCFITVTFNPALPVGGKSATLTVSSNDPLAPSTTVTAGAVAVLPYTINASASTGGTITPAGQIPIAPDAGQTFIFTPDTGFRLQDVVVDGISQGALGSYTFNNVNAPHTIRADFVAGITVTVAGTAGQGGTISPDNLVTINSGDNKTFFITPDFGYVIADVIVTEMLEDLDLDGNGLGTYTAQTSHLGPVSSFTFFNVRATGSSIAATFETSSVRSWNWRNPLPQGLATRHVETDGNGSYAAVGDFGVIMTSSDGVNWSVRQSGTMNLNSVAYGAGRFVAVGNGGRILRSSTKAADGYASWSEISSGSASTLRGITYNGSVFVAVGNSQISENFPYVPKMTILTSPDGAVWSDHSQLLAINETLDLRDVAAGNGTVVAVGSGGVILTSTDNGNSWRRVPDDLNGRGSTINSITFGSNSFVAVGEFAQITTSYDNGTTWNPVITLDIFDDLKGVAYGTLAEGQNIFAAVGTDGAIITSENLGANWSSQISGLANNGSGAVLHSVVVGTTASAEPQILAAGEFGTLLTSSDSFSWTNRLVSVSSTSLRGVARGNATFVAVGGDPAVIDAPASASIVSSLDNGLTWNARSIPAGSQNLTAATYGNGIFVAVGESAFNSANPTATATILTSTNGTTWTSRSSGSFLGLNAVTFANGRFIAVGDYNPPGNGKPEGAALLTSTNGVTWTFSQIITQNGTPLNGISYSGTTYVAVGELGSLVTSSNGVDWIDRGADTVINGYDLTSIAYGNGTFRAVGLTTEVGVGPRSFVSSNGVNWSSEILPVPTVLNMRFQGIAYFNGQFVAVGNEDFILSKNVAQPGSGWVINTGADSVNSSLYGIAVGNGSFVAVGANGTILQTAQQLPGLPEIEVRPELLAFDPLLVGQSISRTITISNDGHGPLEIVSASVPNGPFSIVNDLCSTVALPPETSCSLEVLFAPQTSGTENVSLSILSNDPDNPGLTVPLSGSASGAFTLTITITGSGSGSVSSAPAGTPLYGCSTGNCPTAHPTGTPVTLTATPADWRSGGIFSGDCSGVDSCQTTMIDHRSVLATFDLINRVRLTAGTSLDHPAIQSAYESAAEGSEIRSLHFPFPEVLLFDRPENVLLRGGWDSGYTTNTAGFSTIQGSLVIRNGSVRVENVKIVP